MYRALFTADIHASNSLPYAQRDPETLVADRLTDALSVLDQMCAYACREGISDIWILGDLVDKRLVDAVTLKMTAERLNSLKRHHTLRLVPGNHEAYDAQARHFILDAFGEMGIWVAGGSNDIVVVGPDQLSIACLPFQPEERARERIKAWTDIAKSEPVILLLHQTILGGKVGEWASPEGIRPEELEPFEFTFSGHFHTPQKVAQRVMYLGAPLQHNFGDRGEARAFWDVLVDRAGDVESCTRVPTEAPAFHEFIGVKGTERRLKEHVRAGDYVRLRIRGPEAEVKQAMKQAAELCQWAQDELKVRYINAIPEPETEAPKQRMKQDGGARRGWTETIGGYLDVCDVTGYSRARLEELGQALVQEAER